MSTCLGCHIHPVFTRAPLVGSLDMDYWCSAFGTKGARVNTGWIWHPKHVLTKTLIAESDISNSKWKYIFFNFCDIKLGKISMVEVKKKMKIIVPNFCDIKLGKIMEGRSKQRLKIFFSEFLSHKTGQNQWDRSKEKVKIIFLNFCDIKRGKISESGG